MYDKLYMSQILPNRCLFRPFFPPPVILKPTTRCPCTLPQFAATCFFPVHLLTVFFLDPFFPLHLARLSISAAAFQPHTGCVFCLLVLDLLFFFSDFAFCLVCLMPTCCWPLPAHWLYILFIPYSTYNSTNILMLTWASKELCKELLQCLIAEEICVLCEQHRWGGLGQVNTLLMGRLVLELVLVIFVPWRKKETDMDVTFYHRSFSTWRSSTPKRLQNKSEGSLDD